MTTSVKRAYSVKELSETIGICLNTAYRMVQDGTIRSVRARNKILIPATALDEYLNGTKQEVNRGIKG